MSIQSPCSIVFTPEGGEPVTLVAEGGWLASLPRFEASQDLYELDGVTSGEAYFKALGGAIVSISFTAEKDEENPHEAFLNAAMAGAVNLLNVQGELVVSGGGEGKSYSPAVIESISPGLPFGPEALLTREFSIKAGLPRL